MHRSRFKIELKPKFTTFSECFTAKSSLNILSTSSGRLRVTPASDLRLRQPQSPEGQLQETLPAAQQARWDTISGLIILYPATLWGPSKQGGTHSSELLLRTPLSGFYQFLEQAVAWLWWGPRMLRLRTLTQEPLERFLKNSHQSSLIRRQSYFLLICFVCDKRSNSV